MRVKEDHGQKRQLRPAAETPEVAVAAATADRNWLPEIFGSRH